MKRILIILVLILIALSFLFYSLSQADTVQLAWDPMDDVDGYRIYQREKDREYNYRQPSCDTQVNTCTVEGLSPGTEYFFVARAYAGNDESGDSNEVLHAAEIREIGSPLMVSVSHMAGQINEILVILKGEEEFTGVYCGNPVSLIYHEDSHWCGDGGIEFGTPEEAEQQGYRKCEVCKP